MSKRRRRFTDEQLIENLKKVEAINPLLPLLGLTKNAGNHRTVKRRIKHLNLDTSHILGKSSVINHVSRKARPLEVYLKEGSCIGSYHLKQRLLNAGLLEYRCCICGIVNWQDKTISLELDHINGISDDNRIENLRLLCPNCHSQTLNYSGRNINKKEIRSIFGEIA